MAEAAAEIAAAAQEFSSNDSRGEGGGSLLLTDQLVYLLAKPVLLRTRYS